MAILRGDTGKVADGTLKTFSLTYPTPYESLQGTPISVPNVGSLPGTPLASYTVQSSDFPTISPSPVSTKYTGILVISGKNTDSSARTVNFQINKNGSNTVASSFSANASSYWTQTIYKFMDVVAGDVLDIYLYCSASALINYDYVSFFIIPTQLLLSNASIVKDVSFTIAPSVTLASGTPSVSFTGVWYVYPSTNVSGTGFALGMNANASGMTFSPLANIYAFGRSAYGDANGYGNGIYNTLVNHATNHPNYNRNYVPTAISFREVLR